MLLRLDKFLADMGVGTRKDVKEILKKRRVKVDGQLEMKPERKVDPEKNEITLDGESLTYKEYEYFMLNKPAGVISASNDSSERTVVDLVEGKSRKDLFPVGRLDRDTVGLLLITNDGALAHRLLSPAHHVDKCYEVRLDGMVGKDDVKAFQTGIDIGDEDLTLPAELELLETGAELTSDHVKVSIREGRFHQIKRMFEARGRKVVYLKRLSMGSLLLDESLPEGSSRQLTDLEIELLKK